MIQHPRRLRLLLGVALCAAVAVLLLHKGGFWDENLADLSPIPAADATLDATLRQDLGVADIRYFAVLKAPDEQQALQQSEALVQKLRPLVETGQLGGFDAPSDILPSVATQLIRQTALPDAADLQSRLKVAATGLPFRANTFAPFLRDTVNARSARLINVASLPPALQLRLDSMLTPVKGGWVVMAPLEGVADPSGVAAAIRAASLQGAQFVDLNAESAALLARFQREALTLAIAGSITIVILLLAGLRSLQRVLAVAAPLAAAVLTTLALIILAGAKISIFMVVGLLLIVAVGSNYCLFFERAEPDTEIRQRAIASIVLANLCTVCAYGLMSLSHIAVLHDIGLTVALGTFLSLVYAALLSRQPAPC